MDFHWDWNCDTLFEHGCHCSAERPPRGAIAHVGQAISNYPYQVTWLADRSSIQDFRDLPSESYNTWEEAVRAVEATIRVAGHTVDGT